MTLGDELLWKPNLTEMVENFSKTGVDGLCGVLPGKSLTEIRNNYSVHITQEGLIDQLVEKPTVPFNDLMGLGYCIMQTSTLPYAMETPVSPERQQREFCDWLLLCIQQGLHFRPFRAGQGVVNLNSVQDLEELEKRFTKITEDKA